MPCISLLSDFGLSDSFVGEMKGVMLGLCPEAHFIDICHDLPRHDIVAGAWQLARACDAFPLGTVHLAVVDPGVGSARRGIVAERNGQFFVAPDNGLCALAFARRAPSALHVIDCPDRYRSPCSHTFHGRDIFAPVAAQLAAGMALADVGPLTTDWQRLAQFELPGARVVHIDHFGNCATNISAERIGPRSCVSIGDQRLPLHDHYAAVTAGTALALVGSDGFLELTVNSGNAAEQLGLAVGDEFHFASEA